MTPEQRDEWGELHAGFAEADAVREQMQDAVRVLDLVIERNAVEDRWNAARAVNAPGAHKVYLEWIEAWEAAGKAVRAYVERWGHTR